jgi:hypothetical protein
MGPGDELDAVVGEFIAIHGTILPPVRRLANMDMALEIASHRLQMTSRNLAASFSKHFGCKRCIVSI